ncbi:MAG: flagellar hook-associated protein FlgK [bacterium]
MSTLGGILNTGREALLVQQLKMQIIGHNTANVNTAGFSRRRLDLMTAPAIVNSNGWFYGSGVAVEDLRRIRDTVLDSQFRRTNTTLGYWTQLEDSMTRVEEVFNEFGGSAISDHLQAFWDAWQDLANDPESLSTRTNLISRAQTLASSLNRVHNGLRSRREELDLTLVQQTGEINQLTAEIAALNVRIVNAEVSGGEAGDLRDRRDLLLDRLSEYVPITTHENDGGAVNVYLGGQILIQVDHAQVLEVAAYSEDNMTLHRVAWSGSGQPIPLGDGKLKATLTARDQTIPNALTKLNTFATTLVQEVNNRHVTGYGLTGSNGFNFWDASTTGAGNIAVDAAIVADPRLIAASSSADAPGDNSIALWIGQLQTERLLDGGLSTLGNYYSNLASALGSETSLATERRTTEEAATNLLEQRRQSVSGVSMDEEMANLIMVQKCYEAAAKLISTVDEMMQTILAMV